VVVRKPPGGGHAGMRRRLPGWLIHALLCILSWGVWGVLAKVAATAMSPDQMQALFTAGMLPLAAAALVQLRGRLETDRRGPTMEALPLACWLTTPRWPGARLPWSAR